MKVFDLFCRLAEPMLVLGSVVMLAGGQISLAIYAISLACYANLINNKQGDPT